MDKLIFRMSEAGECPKALVAERLGHESAPPPAWLETAAKEGRRHEQWVKEELREEGYIIEDWLVCTICKERYEQERQGIHVELEFENFILIGHTDGRFIKDGRRGGLEIKSRSQYEFDRWMKEGFAGFSDNACQLTVYMAADPNEEWLYIVKNRSSGYQDRRIVTEPPASMIDITSKLNVVVEFIQHKKLPEDEFDPNSLQCRRCNFQKLCIPEPKALTPVEESNLHHAAKDWRRGKELKAEGEGLIGWAIGNFETHTKATGIERWRFDELAISTVHVKETLNYPKKKLVVLFGEEELRPASEIKLPYDYIKIKDLRREESGEETGNAEMSE